jgi:hypothetical protein
MLHITWQHLVSCHFPSSPLLLDPLQAANMSYLTFDSAGTPAARHSKEQNLYKYSRAAASIRCYHLDRSELNKDLGNLRHPWKKSFATQRSLPATWKGETRRQKLLISDLHANSSSTTTTGRTVFDIICPSSTLLNEMDLQAPPLVAS